MATVAPTLVRLSRGYVAVTGPKAADFLERMVSNEVASLEPGDDRRGGAATDAEGPDRRSAARRARGA